MTQPGVCACPASWLGSPRPLRRGAPFVALALALALALGLGGPTPVAAQGARKPADTYPLGPLEAQGMPASGGIVVKAVTARGPGAKAGLTVGDRITAAGGSALGANAWRALGAALLKAEAKAEPAAPALTLTVSRGGGTQTLTVTLPRRPAPGATLATSPWRKAVSEEAIKALVKDQERDGGWPARLGATNGRCVTTSVAIIAMLAANDPGARRNPRDREIKKAIRFLSKQAGKDPIARALKKQRPNENWNQTNWAFAFAGIAAGLRYKANPKDRSARSLLVKAAKALAGSQQASGGWAHGPGTMKNALGYLELWVVSGYALTALGLAKQAGVRVPEDAITKGLGYLDQCLNPSGAVGYSHIVRGMADLYRTSIAMLALSAVGQRGAPKYRQAGAYFEKNYKTPARLEVAHQGYLLHLLTTALAARERGDAEITQFFKAYRPDFVLLRSQARGGHYTVRPTPETLRLGANNDRSLGDAWATAVAAAILATPNGGLPRFAPPASGTDNSNSNNSDGGKADPDGGGALGK